MPPPPFLEFLSWVRIPINPFNHRFNKSSIWLSPVWNRVWSTRNFMSPRFEWPCRLWMWWMMGSFWTKIHGCCWSSGGFIMGRSGWFSWKRCSCHRSRGLKESDKENEDQKCDTQKRRTRVRVWGLRDLWRGSQFSHAVVDCFREYNKKPPPKRPQEINIH